MGKLKKHELLTKAMLDYPAGTVARFKTAPHVHHTSNGIFSFCDFNNDGKLHIICSGTGGNCVYSDGEWATVIPDKVSNFGEILFEKMGIEKVEFVKPSLLSGRCAIQVNNEREFKLLMEHCHSKDFKWAGGQSALDTKVVCRKREYPVFIFYNKALTISIEMDYDDCELVPFDQFAKEVGVEAPVFVMTSEDGVAMYRGDDYYRTCFIEGEWRLTSGVGRFTENDPIRMPAFKSAWFSTREAADKWIAEQNKPKEVSIDYGSEASCVITSNKVVFKLLDGIGFELSSVQLEEIYREHKSLQP